MLPEMRRMATQWLMMSFVLMVMRYFFTAALLVPGI